MARFPSIRTLRGPRPPRRAPRGFPLVLLVSAISCGLATLGHAEIYRCVGADGRTVFSSRPDACPGARPHRPAGQVQRMQGGARPARRAPAASGFSEAEAARWRAKRRNAETEKRRVENDLTGWKQVVTWCNRGGDLYVKDEAGIKHGYRCDDAQSRYEELQQRFAELEEYLARGLSEECRRAGCLPGWIR